MTTKQEEHVDLMKFKTIVLSDIHLGSNGCRTEDLISFFDKYTCETLILNGDIIDGWSLSRGHKWSKSDTKIIRKILKISQKETEVIWIKGNHDEFLKDFIPFGIGNISIVPTHTHNAVNGKTMFMFHGDVLDFFITKAKWISYIGSIGYDLALWLNRVYNKYRSWRNLPYYSISKDIKNGVKKAVDFVNDFEVNAAKLAKQHYCDTAVCGHIHQPVIKENYMNSGDWCENCTALAETITGDWMIIEHHAEPKKKKKKKTTTE